MSTVTILALWDLVALIVISFFVGMVPVFSHALSAPAQTVDTVVCTILLMNTVIDLIS